MFKGILIEKDDAGYRASLKDIDEAQLPEGDVTVRVSHSTLNYKDGLAITGKGPVVRRFPMVPGIDLVGTIESSTHADYQPGDSVLLNGWGVGEGHWGGLAQKARLKGDWLVPLPKQFSPQQAMAIGTAGYTAMLCVLALERHGVKPEHGEIVVSGAAGGVGSVATAVLEKLGYTVEYPTADWTWDDFNEANRQMLALLNSADKIVGIIFDIRNGGFPPSGAMKRFKQVAETKHANGGQLIFVAPKLLTQVVRSTLDLLKVAFLGAFDAPDFIFVTNLDEAKQRVMPMLKDAAKQGKLMIV